MGTSSVPSDLAVGHSVFFECRLPPAANFRTYKSLQFGFRVKGDSRLNRGFLSCSFVVKPICSRRKMRGAGEFGGVHVSGVEHRRGSDKGVAVSAGGENSTMNPNAQHAMVDSNSVESSIPRGKPSLGGGSKSLGDCYRHIGRDPESTEPTRKPSQTAGQQKGTVAEYPEVQQR